MMKDWILPPLNLGQVNPGNKVRMSTFSTSRSLYYWFPTSDICLYHSHPLIWTLKFSLWHYTPCLHIPSFGKLIHSMNTQSSPLFSIAYPKVYWIPSPGSLIVISSALYPKLYSPSICKLILFAYTAFPQAIQIQNHSLI